MTRGTRLPENGSSDIADFGTALPRYGESRDSNKRSAAYTGSGQIVNTTWTFLRCD